VRAVPPELIRLPDGPQPVREVFLVLPGLNFRPDRLEPWEALLTGRGAAVVRPALQGYAQTGAAAWRTVTADGWVENVAVAYLRLRERFPAAAVSLFGYSLGGALGLVWSRRYGLPFHRALLLGPALMSRRWGWIGLTLCTLLPGRIVVRSYAPRSYRVHDVTSLAAYRAVHGLIAEFRSGSGNDPSAVFVAISPRDELVSPKAAAAYVQRLGTAERSGAARLHLIDHRPRPGWLYHLGVDAATLGDGPWSLLRADVEQWLAATAPS
jgi:pimeloyl-ACP methyl ester carboxylesterase